ncbi:hypothetical protein MKW92_014431 [Papaver armeniacum]|nr:hypothetical protein MKW92_014431 [Papaver armeniacum]
MHLAQNRGRKTKGVKMTSGLFESGSSWAQFEDQALVVLVHDMGPNWELVSDVINSTLQFKAVVSAFAGPSGRGYALRLTLRKSFPLAIGQHQHSRKIQNDNQDQKQTVSVHNSHVLALSQYINLSLFDNEGLLIFAANPDLSHGYQGSHSSSLGIANQGYVAPVLPTSGLVVVLSPCYKDLLLYLLIWWSKTNFTMDEQQRMHYNHMSSGRNLQHPGLSAPGSLTGGDRGVRVVPGSNSIEMMLGMNRGTPPWPGFQGVGSPSMLNMVFSGSMHPATAVGMPNSVNMHNGSVSDHGTSMTRPRDMMHMMRPGQNPDDQRQMMMQEFQMQHVSQGNSQGHPAFNVLSSGFPNQMAPPPGQTFPVLHLPHSSSNNNLMSLPSTHSNLITLIFKAATLACSGLLKIGKSSSNGSCISSSNNNNFLPPIQRRLMVNHNPHSIQYQLHY